MSKSHKTHGFPDPHFSTHFVDDLNTIPIRNGVTQLEWSQWWPLFGFHVTDLTKMGTSGGPIGCLHNASLESK